MAEDTPPGWQSWTFDFLSSSYQPYAPLRSMQESGFRSGSFNGILHDGIFRTRGGIQDFGLNITVDANGAFSEKYNGQAPGEIWAAFIKDVSTTTESPVLILVTTNECFLYTLSGVTNLTPRYAAGTISITTGTKALSGTATAWNAEGIKAGQLVNLPDGSANWYSIDTVNSDTSITLLQTYGGATLTNQTYRIRRTGRSGSGLSGTISDTYPRNLFARIFNGDLYYTYVEGFQNACVVRVTNVIGTPGTPEIIGAALFDNLSGCDIWANQNGVQEIKGLELLSDGRVVLATTETDSTSGTLAQARVRYSSHLDQKVWNTAPGGYTDVVNLIGKMNGMRDFGSYLACHYDCGIVMGVPNGQDDPPLSFQRVQNVTVGCINAKAMASTPYGQAFLGADNNVYLFDGSGTTPVTDACREGAAGIVAGSAWFGCYEQARSTFWLFDGFTSSSGTLCYGIDLQNQLVTFHKSGTTITAACDAIGNALNTRIILGLPSYDTAASGTAGATSHMVYYMNFDTSSTADVVPAFTNKTAPAAITLISDWIDFGMPGIDKTLSHALLYYISTGTYTVRLKATRDGLSSETISFSASNTSTEEKVAKIFFSPKTSEKWQFTLDTATLHSSAWNVEPQRMILYYRPVANMEPVPR